MMKLIKYPSKEQWAELLKRPALNTESLFDTVRTIINKVRAEGDKAVLEYEAAFDKVTLSALTVTSEEIQKAEGLISDELKSAITLAKRNIETFHSSQRFVGKKVETMEGVTCWQKAVGIEKVGLYIPGGTAPLFSTVLMLAVPAKIAGCREIVLCTPPDKNGNIHPAILFAAQLAGVSKIFKAGGVQAIAAMAYGTESVPKVYKIFGPGNQYVTAAKQLVSLRDVAIDMPAGPSEVEVLADASANPVFVAADLLSQAEHGVDSQAMLITTSEKLQAEVMEEVNRQLAKLPRREIAAKSLENSKLILVKDMDEALELTNAYAPEHLIVETENYLEVAERVINAGSVFLGSLTPESAGDYASGTNHTLPTNGYAKAYSGVSLDSFIRKITFQEILPQGMKVIGPAIEEMAANELLDAHKNAVTVRLNTLKTLQELTRPNIWKLKPYSSARDEYKGAVASVFLDANENPYNLPHNRYPDPMQWELKTLLSKIKKVSPQHIFLGNGSDEAIDLVFRAFCEPEKDNVVAIDPTYGMYQVCADVNNVEYRKVLLDENFQFSAEKLLAATDERTKLIFLCSPNNPTGNDLLRSEIEKILREFEGLVILDEAYNDFSEAPSFLEELDKYPNLVVFQTFSKAWGCAAIRLGMAFASEAIIGILSKIKYPYNVNQLTQQQAIAMLHKYYEIERWIKTLKEERDYLEEEFAKLSCTVRMYPSDSNFFLAKVTDAVKIYNYLVGEGIIVRNRHSISLCCNCLRVTVGTRVENNTLLAALKKYQG